MTEDATHSWPIGLRRLAEVIGPAAAVRLADAYGGVEDLRIPKTARPDHDLAKVLTRDEFEALCAAYGGERLDIPKGVYKDLKKTAIMDAAGSNREVALRLKVTQRYVRRVRAEVRRDQDPDLFD